MQYLQSTEEGVVPLETALQVIMSYSIGAENQTGVLLATE